MTSEFEGFERDLSAENLYLETEDSTPDSFELLSAYIDGELSPSERKQVQTWLDRDPEFKQLYTQLLTLQSQIQHFVAPSSEKTTAEITEGVFRTIDRQRRHRRKLIWGSSAIAASAIAAMSNIIPGFSPLSPNMAEMTSPPGISNTVMLAVALDQPAINIPKSINGYGEINLDIEQN